LYSQISSLAKRGACRAVALAKAEFFTEPKERLHREVSHRGHEGIDGATEWRSLTRSEFLGRRLFDATHPHPQAGGGCWTSKLAIIFANSSVPS
jgi:hypothetical protein